MRFPITHYLVPAEADPLPDSFTRRDVQLTEFIPHRMQLTDNLTLTLALPNGLAQIWRELDGTTVISRSTDQTKPQATLSTAYSLPLTLIIHRNKTLLGTLPVVSGVTQTITDAANAAVLDVHVISWELMAGNLRGRGDFGARFSFAWCLRGSADATFSTPPLHPQVFERYEYWLRSYFRLFDIDLDLSTLEDTLIWYYLEHLLR
jgi:hypothetical protein